MEGLSETCTRKEGTSRQRDGKILCKPELRCLCRKAEMSEWIVCPAFAILLPKPLFCMRGLLRGPAALKDELESWHINAEAPCSAMFIARGLRRRKNSCACQ